jgi:homoserine kinase type II
VLTLFERLTFEQLPFYLHLMKHLAQHGIPVPDPAADPRTATSCTRSRQAGRLVNKLAGKQRTGARPRSTAPRSAPCWRACTWPGRDYNRHQPNLRGLAWWNETVPVVLPFVTEQAALLRGELAFQNHVAASSAYARCRAARCMPTCSATT